MCLEEPIMFMRLGEENVLKEIAYAKSGRGGITLSENSNEFIMAKRRK